MKKPYKHWTKEDDTCLLNHIKNNSDNLRKAFRLASCIDLLIQLPRSTDYGYPRGPGPSKNRYHQTSC